MLSNGGWIITLHCRGATHCHCKIIDVNSFEAFFTPIKNKADSTTQVVCHNTLLQVLLPVLPFIYLHSVLYIQLNIISSI